MEKYFIITNEKFNKDYDKFEKDWVLLTDIYNIMRKEFDIKTGEYYPYLDHFRIGFNQEDYDKFKSVMLKNKESFRKNSAQTKRWLELIKEYGITRNIRPRMAWDYIITGCGSTSSCSNRIDGIIYGRLEYSGSFKLPEGFNEIKASEYHAAFEKYEEQCAKEI